ncbi:GntR family transcriptional regulator [bacterium]|nr:GntR family transcriptional regulator [bacterium]
MLLRMDLTSDVPFYLQIIQQIKTEIAKGRLHAGDALPSVRDLAMDLAINPNTVARAYLELEHEGIVFKRQGHGTFISRKASVISRREKRNRIQASLEKAVVEGVALDLTTKELRAIFEALLQKLEETRKSRKRAIK